MARCHLDHWVNEMYFVIYHFMLVALAFNSTVYSPYVSDMTVFL